MVWLYSENPAMFFERELWVQRKPGEEVEEEESLVPFILNSQQWTLFEIIWLLWTRRVPVRLIILKERQWGCSTLIQAFLYWMQRFIGNSDCVVVAQDDDGVSKVWRKYKTFNASITHPEIAPRFLYRTKNGMTLEPSPDATYTVEISIHSVKNPHFAAGSTLRGAHHSEVARWRQSMAKDCMLTVRNTMPLAPFTFEAQESTAWGANGYFYDAWSRSSKFYGGEIRSAADIPDDTPLPLPVFFPWTDCEWYTKDPKDVPQEFADGLAEWREARDDGDTEAAAAIAHDLRLGRAIFDVEEANQDPREMEYAARPDITAGQLLWRRETIQSKCDCDPNLFDQEFPDKPEVAFLMSGGTVFSQVMIRRRIEQVLAERNKPVLGRVAMEIGDSGKNPVWMDDISHGNVHVWHKPVPGAKYFAAADTAQGGKDGDWSVCQVWRTTPLRHVATLRLKCDEIEFAQLTFALTAWYNGALTIVEIRTTGRATMLELMRMGHSHLYLRPEVGTLASENLAELDVPFGWDTNRRTRPIMVGALREFARTEMLSLTSDLQLLHEMLIWKRGSNGVPTHPEGEHDDCVITAGIILCVWRQMFDPYAGLVPKKHKWTKKERMTVAIPFDDEEDDSEVHPQLGVIGPGESVIWAP